MLSTTTNTITMDFNDPLYPDHGLLLAPNTTTTTNTPIAAATTNDNNYYGPPMTPFYSYVDNYNHHNNNTISGPVSTIPSSSSSSCVTPSTTPNYIDYTYDQKNLVGSNPLPQQYLNFDPPPHPPPNYYNVIDHQQPAMATSSFQPPPPPPHTLSQAQSLQPPIKLRQSSASSSSSNSRRASKKNSNSSLPGPIPASTPTLVKRDELGVEWISFEYSKDRVKSSYCIRCDIEKVDISQLNDEFKSENCIYPRATVPPEQYTGNRQKYETECNCIGWCLAYLNTSLRHQRGLIQRAVDSWRNTNADPSFRSRRVRRLSKKSSQTKNNYYSQPINNTTSISPNRSKSVSNDSIPQSYSTPNLLDLSTIQPFTMTSDHNNTQHQPTPTFTNPFDSNHSVIYNYPTDISPTSSRTSSTTSLVQKRTASTIDTCPY